MKTLLSSLVLGSVLLSGGMAQAGTNPFNAQCEFTSPTQENTSLPCTVRESDEGVSMVWSDGFKTDLQARGGNRYELKQGMFTRRGGSFSHDTNGNVITFRYNFTTPAPAPVKKTNPDNKPVIRNWEVFKTTVGKKTCDILRRSQGQLTTDSINATMWNVARGYWLQGDAWTQYQSLNKGVVQQDLDNSVTWQCPTVVQVGAQNQITNGLNQLQWQLNQY